MNGQKRIMVIDDSSTIRSLVANVLTKYGYQVVLAGCIEDALRDFKNFNINVVITDLIMPGMGGIAGIALLLNTWPEVGIVAMSAGSSAVDADTMLSTARRIGAHRMLKKPFSQTELLGTINGLIEQGFGEEERREMVLVVDDSRTIRAFVSQALVAAGYEVVALPSMEEALESPTILSVDLIITDIFMPGLGGIAGIMRIRENWPHVPIIAMSSGLDEGLHREDALSAAKKIGANTTLAKPFSAVRLAEVVGSILG